MTPTKEVLRKFGLTMSLSIAIMFGILLPLLFNFSIPHWPWPLATFFLILSFIGITPLKYIYIVWMTIGEILGAINSRIILTIFFFLVITPIGVILRILKKNPLSLKWDKSSYRQDSPEPTSLKLPF